MLRNRINLDKKDECIQDWYHWKEIGDCPNCHRKDITIKVVEKWGINNNPFIAQDKWWKYSCRSCSHVWFPITEKNPILAK